MDETVCCVCGNVTTTMVNTHYMSVCPECCRMIVRNYVADKLKSGEIKNVGFKLDCGRPAP